MRGKTRNQTTRNRTKNRTFSIVTLYAPRRDREKTTTISLEHFEPGIPERFLGLHIVGLIRINAVSRRR
jgi:hypothetical protein